MSNDSMKNLRKISKETTRNLILEKTKQLIISNGILKTSTKQIADLCKVAHGTIFSHFNSREVLIGTIIKEELIRIAQKLYQIAEINGKFVEMLEEYLNLVIEEEELLIVINKEFPFFSEYLKNEIITTETIVKKFFYNKLLEESLTVNREPLNISVVISILSGTISYYLTRKEYFVSSGSVINKKKEDIIKIFLNILK
jgi:AcrR family transcriptional regulator